MINRSHALVLALGAALVAQPSFSAPKPPPGATTTDPAIMEAFMQQQRFLAVGLTVPQVPANGGLCLIETSGHVTASAGQTHLESYRLYEMQTWVVSTVPVQAGQIPLTYAVKWASAGNGFRHEDNGVGTTNDWKFSISATHDTTLTARKTLASAWLVQVAPTSVSNGVTVTQQQTISGRANQPVTAMGADSSVGILGMTISAPPGSPPNAPVSWRQKMAWRVPSQIGWGYPMPAYVTGNINCTWNLAVGP